MSVATLRRHNPLREMSPEKLCRRLLKVVMPDAASASSASGSSAGRPSVPAPANAATVATAEKIAKARKAVADRARALGE